MYFDSRPDGSADIYYINAKLKDIAGLGLLYAETNSRSRLEEINNLYVAFTRAAEELYCYLPSSKRLKNMFAAAIFGNKSLDGFVDESGARMIFGEYTDVAAMPQRENDEKPEKVRYFRGFSPGVRWMDLLKKRERPPGKLPDRTSARDEKAKNAEERGILVHEILAGIKEYSGKALEERVDYCLKRRGLHQDEKFRSDLEAMLNKAFNDEKFLAFYRIDAADQALTEREIVDRHARLRRVDRLVVRKDRVELLDLKTGAEYSEDHAVQMKDYSELVASLYPDKPVKAWLYYLDSSELRECPQPGRKG